MKDQIRPLANAGKFVDPLRTAKGEDRAQVALTNPQTLWFNTGTLCNITCVNCYIESSPTNDALVYLSLADVEGYLDQLETRQWGVREIAFTGGEPFMNPEIISLLDAALSRGYEVLVLTNAMLPMMRKRVQAGLLDLNTRFPSKLTLRISLDHHSAALHDAERGKGSFQRSLKGMEWLRDHAITMTVAGRSTYGETDTQAREGYAAIYLMHNFNIDAYHPAKTVIFPEMDLAIEVPEITTACWGILDKSPDSVMCSSSRMVVKRKGAEGPSVVACTLLPYDPQFDMGPTLAEAERPVALNHPHCAKFCVLGGASCSA